MKIQVNISDEMLKKVDSYAKKLGISRSSLCALFIGQGVMGFDVGIENAIEGAKELANENN